MMIQDAFKLYLKDAILTRKSPKTLDNYINSMSGLSNYITRSLSQQDLSLVVKATIENYFLFGIEERRWSKYTHWTHYKNIKLFFNWCVIQGYITESPLTQISKPRLPHSYPKSLTGQEAQRLLKTFDNRGNRNNFIHLRNKAIVTMFMYTGIRRGELLSLRYDDVDLESDFIYIKKGKGDRFREIPIEKSILRPTLLAYLEVRNLLFNTHDWLFKSYSQLNKEYLSERALRAIFIPLNSLIGKRLYPHMLRHTFATLLLEKTGDIYVLKELMGHSRISTTEIYLSTTRKKKVEAISNLSLINS